MAEEAAAVLDAPASEEPLSAPMIRPEARAALDDLSKRIHGDKPPATPPETPETKVEPSPAATAPKAKPAAKAEPAKADPEVLTPPDSLLGDLPAKPVETVAEELFPEEPPAAIKTEKGKADYKKWRETYKAMETRVKELESKPPSDEKAVARIAELEGRLQEFSQRFERINLMEHPDFIRQFEAPLRELRGTATEIVKNAGLDPEALAAVMGKTGIDRIKAMDQLAETIESPTLRRRLERTVEDIEAKEAERDKVLSDVKGNTERLTTQQKIQQHQAMQDYEKRMNSTIDGVENYLATDQKIAFFQKAEGPGADKWNEALEADKAETRQILFNSKNEAQFAGVVALGVKAPRILAWGMSERKMRVAAEKALADLRGAEPSLGGSNGDGPRATVEDDPKDNDMSTDAIRRRLHKHLGR